MKYYRPVIDGNGYTHSVDMVIVDYYLKCQYTTASKKLIELLSSLDGFDVSKNTSLDNRPNFKYQFYVDMIWFDGFVVHLGKYTEYDKETNDWIKLDMIRIKVNPNKHICDGIEQTVFEVIKPFLSEWCTDGFLVRWDYAIDVPVPPSEISVIGSRKEKGLYKGTRYYGQRHKHGYLKIYDKQKEQKLDSPLTRIEYTLQAGLPPSWDNIMIRAPVAVSDVPKSDLRSAALYLDMLLEIKALGGDIEPFIERMNYRTYKKIEPFLYSGKQLQCDGDLIDKLLNIISDIFIIADVEQQCNALENEFMECGTDLPLPFD